MSRFNATRSTGWSSDDDALFAEFPVRIRAGDNEAATEPLRGRLTQEMGLKEADDDCD